MRHAKAAALVRLIGSAIALLAFFYPQTSRAAPYVFPTTATTVYRNNVNLSVGTHTIRTLNLSAGCDSFLHLVNATTNVEVGHDDDSGGSMSSLLTVNITTAGWYSLVVRAYSNSTRGTGDVQVDGATFATAVRIGGSVIPVTVTGTVRYDTAFTPGGSRDTFLYGLDLFQGILQSDDDGGVGYASRLTAANIAYVVVSSYDAASEGTTTLYVNDWTNDPDGDGLGTGLEGELGTCAQATCAGVINGKDTDHDGLSDAAEVLGVDDAFPQYLQAWGASPRHKDVFVEVDWSPSFASQPVTGDDMNIVQNNFYSLGKNADVLNPDGTDGIRIHADIGSNVPGQTVYGSWGGSSRATVDNYVQAWGDPASFAVVRRSLFRYAIIGNADGGGQSNAIPGTSFGWGGRVEFRYPNGFAHELGHLLGLDHHGHNSWGTANCKPNYQSIMNYSFPNAPFSQGLNTVTLNPSRVSEFNSFPGAADPSYLQGSPFWFTTNLKKIDWNRDGAFLDTSTGFVRAPVTWAPVNSCSAFEYGTQTLREASNAMATESPKLVKLGNYLYVFDLSDLPEQRLQYRFGAVSGADANGSCPGGTANCMTWGARQITPASPGLVTFSVTPWLGKILLVYQDVNTGIIRSSVATANASGALSWSTPQGVTTSLGAPDLSIMYVNPSIYDGKSEVAAIHTVTNVGGQVTYSMFTTGDLQSPWVSRGPVVRSDGAYLTGFVPPTVVSWPNRGGISHASIGTSCGTFHDMSKIVRFYCYDKTTNRWTDLSANMYSVVGGDTSVVKTALAYHVLRNDTGVPVNSDITRGQFFMVTIPEGTGDRPKLRISSMLNSTTPPGTSTVFSIVGQWWNEWAIANPNTNVSLYEDESLSALKATMIDSTYFPTQRLFFMPFADGTPNLTLKDGNDFRVMERGICMGIRGDTTWCGASNQWGY